MSEKLTALRASVISLPAEHWLSNMPTAQVLHVFDRSCNLITGNDHVLSLVAAEIDPGPSSIVLEQPNRRGFSFSKFIDLGDVISFPADDATTLQVGRLSILYDIAERWDPRLEEGMLQRQAAIGHLDQMRHLITRLSSVDSVAFALGAHNKSVYQERIALAWGELKSGIASRDMKRCARGGRLAAGVGIGLTPAGDDFLLGVLIAMWLGMVKPQQYIDAIVNAATVNTVRLSAAMLASAGAGAFSRAWHDLALALTRDDEKAIMSTSHRILSTGHSSGADALSGFIVALELVCGISNRT